MKTHRLATLACLLALSTPLSSQAASNDQLFFVYSLGLGYNTFKFPEKFDQDLTFAATEVSAATLYRRWIVSATASGSLYDEPVSEENETGNASRRDYDLLLGYRVNDVLMYFAGYKLASTDIHFVERDTENHTRDYYRQNGFYFGGSLTKTIKGAGKLTFSLAYANLHAGNKFAANVDEVGEADATEFDDISGRVSGHSKGFSYGLSWSMPVHPRIVYQAKFKMNDYRQSIDFDGQRFSGINETFFIYTMGLAYIM